MMTLTLVKALNPFSQLLDIVLRETVTLTRRRRGVAVLKKVTP